MIDCLVIGGGPAGMMAAIAAAEQGASVTLLEPNERLGKKLNITGKGRCNVTNACSLEELLANIPRNGRFLYSAFSQFNAMDTMAFFERLGVALKTERGNRVFPVSDRSFDISGALERRMRQLGVRWVKDRARSLRLSDGVLRGVTGEKGSYEASAVIVATGGVSYPATGSTGDGYTLAGQAGHSIIPPRGSLVPLREAGALCAALQGLSLRNVSITVWEGKKKVYHDFGELLFTHFGLSGPLILSASAHVRQFERGCCIFIDLKPGLDEQTLDKRLLSDFDKYRNSDFINALGDLLPQKLIPVLVEQVGIPPRQKVHEITREQRRALLERIKSFPVEIAGPMPVETAIITAGGVKVGEVQPGTMESKLLPGLYLAGEVLDVDAYTGGFNLQIAWSTGWVAGKAAAEQEKSI